MTNHRAFLWLTVRTTVLVMALDLLPVAQGLARFAVIAVAILALNTLFVPRTPHDP